MRDAKEVALDFFQAVLIEKNPAEGARRFFGPAGYIQHNPGVPSGPAEGFVAALTAYFAQFPEWRTEIKRVIADGDLVAVHHHVRRTPDDRGMAVVDIFRVEGEFLVEHWDVIQEVPAEARNDNTMF